MMCLVHLLHKTDQVRGRLLATKRRTLDRQLGAILAPRSRCDLTRDLQAKIGRARHQLLLFLNHPGVVEPTKNGSERLLCPSVIQRMVTNGYSAMWAAEGEAAICTSSIQRAS